MNWYLTVLKNYKNFNGRARRKEFWMFSLISLIFTFVAILLDNLFGSNLGVPSSGGLIYILYQLFIFIPSLAVSVRRLHDVDKSGWMLFIILIPIIGAIWLFVLNLTEGTKGENKYGQDPKN
jgi:uncharacterized membrane protein YhaH (DUF805 family)